MKDIDRRISLLLKVIEVRSDREPEYRSGAVKFSDAIAQLQAYLDSEQRKYVKTE